MPLDVFKCRTENDITYNLKPHENVAFIFLQERIFDKIWGLCIRYWCRFENKWIKIWTPTATKPESVPGSPNSSVSLMIGAINAKLLPRKMGTLPLVTA